MTIEGKVFAIDHDGKPDGHAELRARKTSIDLRRLIKRLKSASEGGPFTAWMASDAAEVIEKMLDGLTGRAVVVPATSIEWKRRPRWNPAARSSDDLSDAEIDRLLLINQKLAAAEQWILLRQAQALSDYFKAGGVQYHTYSDELREDLETEVEICCVLREDHPGFDEDDDNIVAKLIWLDGIYSDDIGITDWNQCQLSDGHRLQHEPHCYLFHYLTEHVLGYDWDRVLSIGAIYIDVGLIQQREMYF
jgi:hypothetical protein